MEKKFTVSRREEQTEKLERLRGMLNSAEAVLIGAGAGLSTSAGFTYSGERFRKYFADFEEKYGFHDMYSGGFYPFPSPEEFWAYWSRYIYINRYDQPAGKPYERLLELVRDKNYFVLTTNVDHRFQTAGFDKERLFYTQGDYGLFQCSVPCHKATYDNEENVRAMLRDQEGGKIPSSLIPHCPVCGKPMRVNLRADDTFVEDDGWLAAYERYEAFLRDNAGKKILFFELGVGMNTPSIIKYPFWQMAWKNKAAMYACINLDAAIAPQQLAERSVCFAQDIGKVLSLV